MKPMFLPTTLVQKKTTHNRNSFPFLVSLSFVEDSLAHTHTHTHTQDHPTVDSSEIRIQRIYRQGRSDPEPLCCCCCCTGSSNSQDSGTC
jgi:hypothetical protein